MADKTHSGKAFAQKSEQKYIALSFLTFGPAIGVWAIYTFRQLPESKRLAGGKR